MWIAAMSKHKPKPRPKTTPWVPKPVITSADDIDWSDFDLEKCTSLEGIKWQTP